MKKLITTISLIFAGVLLAVSSLQAAEPVRLSGPASMTEALKELIARFGAAGDHAQILTNIGSSGAMAKQINEGAPADIFISANKKWMDFLHDQKRIDPASERNLVGNTLVFIGKKNPAVTSMADILNLRQIAIGSPKSVPAGEYASQAMEKAGIYRKLEEARQLIMAKDVRQALTYADRGETDGAFVYRTDALLAEQAVILFEVPQDLYDRVTYPVALTIEGTQNPEARAFYDFLISPEAMQVFEKYGFSVGK
ncbi:MAG: molybdate ABC transporter substrate-binding protein [Desulfocapsaceae bacterium]|nr:molybdate ABC transporter substrate-binding protein [Desulfocapsaceae bacterium]